MGQSPDGSSFNELKEGTMFYQGRTDFRFRFPSQRLYTTDPKRMAQKNDVLLSVRAPVGDVNIANESCCIGRGLAAIRSKTYYSSFIFYLIKSSKDKFELYNKEGTIFGSINKDSLNGLPVVIPSIEIIEKFEKIIQPIDDMIAINERESRNLFLIRNMILPKLMSGKIDISNIEL